MKFIDSTDQKVKFKNKIRNEEVHIDLNNFMDQINNLIGKDYANSQKIDTYEREIQTEPIVQNNAMVAMSGDSVNSKETMIKKKSSFNFHPSETIDEEFNEDGSDGEVDLKNKNDNHHIMKNNSLPMKHQIEEKLKVDKKDSFKSNPNTAKFNFDGLEDMGEMMDSDLDGKCKT